MQKDLFGTVPVAVSPASMPHKSDFLERTRLSLRLDQTVIGMIALLIIYVLVFSFGVETGKRYAMAELRAERAKRERMAQELGEKIFARNQELQGTAVSAPIVAAPPTAVPAPTAVSIAPVPAAAQAAPAAQLPNAVSPLQSASGRFAIQMIAFQSLKNAEKEVQRLAAKGYRGSIRSRGSLHEVYLAGFETRQKADQALQQLKTTGVVPKDAYIRNA